MSKVRKAVGAVVGAVAASLLVFNVDISPELQAAIITVATAVATYFAPKNAR